MHDGEAYLLEHFLGDYLAALRICLAHVDRCALRASPFPHFCVVCCPAGVIDGLMVLELVDR